MNKFLPGEYISRVHGLARYVEFAGQKIMIIPMYHPAAALRNGAVMLQLEKDFQKIPFLLGQPSPTEKKTITQTEEQLSLLN
jgi:DNA polymerase